jgi:L-2-hydroxyglutarate oxidase LhgO
VSDGVELDVGGDDPVTLRAKTVVDAAGLGAVALARSITGLDPASIPPFHLAKGNYFALSGVRSPFRRLVYPVPEPGGLGVHATLDLGGGVRFGPDVEWIDAIDYTVDPHRADRFYAAVRRYWPALPDGALQPAFAGIRPKLSGPGEAAADFVVQGPTDHGVAGLWTLYGIESPGLTSSLATARHLTATIEARDPPDLTADFDA